jgi:CelD/BcsL family acetyltransferase involved in cellulose biosynthesis
MQAPPLSIINMEDAARSTWTYRSSRFRRFCGGREARVRRSRQSGTHLAGAMVNIAILTSEVEVDVIAESWRKLQSAAGRIPYTDYHFYEAWWHHIGKPEGKTPFIVTGRVDGRLVGLLPLSISISKGMRILRGMGVDAYYLWDCLLEDDAYAEPLWDAVRQSRLYDLAVIRYSDPDSAGGKALAAFAQLCGRDAAPSLDVEWPDSEAWYSLKSAHSRGKNKRAMRHLHEEGVRHHVCTDGTAPLDVVDAMVRQRVDWSIKRELSRGLFSVPGTTDFFRRLVTGASAQNQLYFAWFALAERVVACFLGFRYKERFFIKVISNDPEWSHESPGNLIMIEAVR